MQVMGNRKTHYLNHLMTGNEYRTCATYFLNCGSSGGFRCLFSTASKSILL